MEWPPITNDTPPRDNDARGFPCTLPSSRDPRDVSKDQQYQSVRTLATDEAVILVIDFELDAKREIGCSISNAEADLLFTAYENYFRNFSSLQRTMQALLGLRLTGPSHMVAIIVLIDVGLHFHGLSL